MTGDTAVTNRATNILSNTVYFPNGQRYTALELGIYSDKNSVANRRWYTGELVTDPSSKTVWQSSAHRNNTGTVNTTTDTVAGNWSYTYDPLNRLLTSAGPHGSTTYNMDGFGNKYGQTITAGTAQSQSDLVATTNALTGNGLTYDLHDGTNAPRGNVINDGFHGYTYDAEGRLYSVDGSVCYTYDGDGDRVARTNCNVVNAGNGTTSGILAEFLYDPNHRLMTEVNVSTAQAARANIYAGNQLVAEDAPDSFLSTTSTASLLRVTDQVGSLRGLLDLGEHVVESCTSLPYGDGSACTSSADNELFTGKRRDPESDLDYFGARYYNSNVGRFMSPDWSAKLEPIPDAQLDDPQTLNLYAYVGNNPLTRIDPDGHIYNGTCDSAELSCQSELQNGLDRHLSIIQNDYDPEGIARDRVDYTFNSRPTSKADVAKQRDAKIIGEVIAANSDPSTIAQTIASIYLGLNISSVYNGGLHGGNFNFDPQVGSFDLRDYFNLDRNGIIPSFHLETSTGKNGQLNIGVDFFHIDTANGKSKAGPIHYVWDVFFGTYIFKSGLPQ